MLPANTWLIYTDQLFTAIFYITAACFGRVELTSTDHVTSYTASWRGRGNKVEFELTARGQGWVGIGFSEDRIMVTILCHFYFINTL